MLLRLIEDGKPENFQQQIYDLLGIIANRIALLFADSLYSATNKWRSIDHFVLVDWGLSPKPKAKKIPWTELGSFELSCVDKVIDSTD